MRRPENKLLTSWLAACVWREGHKIDGTRLVMVNGCFDMLHRGHATFLTRARMYGDVLIVALNGDESVRALKGPTRPVVAVNDRAYLLACMEAVDAVVVFNTPRCTDLIELLKPDAYVKAGDYTLDTLDAGERQALENAGARIYFVGLVPGFSTTSLIERTGSVMPRSM